MNTIYLFAIQNKIIFFYNKDFNGTKQIYSREQWRQSNENISLPNGNIFTQKKTENDTFF